ncbi:MAG: DivIVA domain-containing protein [Candidatus Nanopelagicales bacterium]
MTIFFVLIALAAIGVIAVVAAGKIGQIEDPVIDRYRPEIPLAPLAATDLENLRFGTAARGYRMADVDEAMARLAETLRIREAQLAAFNPQLGADGATTDNDVEAQNGSQAPSEGAIQADSGAQAEPTSDEVSAQR